MRHNKIGLYCGLKKMLGKKGKVFECVNCFERCSRDEMYLPVANMHKHFFFSVIYFGKQKNSKQRKPHARPLVNSWCVFVVVRIIQPLSPSRAQEHGIPRSTRRYHVHYPPGYCIRVLYVHGECAPELVSPLRQVVNCVVKISDV